MTIPWRTALCAGFVVVIQVMPGLGELLALDRDAPLELWRLFTGHFTHLSWNHLAWDLAVFAVLGAWLEVRSCRGWTATVVVSALAISAVFWVAMPDLASYRGLSGLDSALTGAVAVELWRTAAARSERVLPVAIAGALAGKIAIELATGHTLFADDNGWVAVPLAHAVGGGMGAMLWAWPPRYQIHTGSLRPPPPARSSFGD